MALFSSIGRQIISRLFKKTISSLLLFCLLVSQLIPSVDVFASDGDTTSTQIAPIVYEWSQPELIIQTGINDHWGKTGNLSADIIVLKNTKVIVPAGVTLTIDAGMIIKSFSPDIDPVSGEEVSSRWGIVVEKEGNFIVNGTKVAPVYFTSYRDDSIGGDTNGDGNSNPQESDWGNVVFMGNNVTSKIIGSVFRYAGSGRTWGVNYPGIIYISSDSDTLEIRGNTFSHATKGIVVDGSRPLIQYNNFIVTENSILNKTPELSLDLTNNYWGDMSGPRHIGNTGGVGSPISNMSLWGMGSDGQGQLGLGSITHKSKYIPIFSGVKAVTAGGYHSLILKDDGSLWATGNNQYGQLGDGTTTDRSVPTQIYSSGIQIITAGGYHSLILKDDGSLWATGNNQYGQLGDGTTIDRSTPVQIYSSGIKAITTGRNHSLILKDDGSLWATGNNQYGQLGDGTKINRSTPVQIYSSGIRAIVAGNYHSLILKDDGSLWATGNNQYGQLGDGTKIGRLIPVQIYSSGIKAIAAGSYHSLILKDDGSLWATGNNQYGQLGDGTTIDRSTFIQVYDSGVQTVVAGSLYSLILKDDGSLWATGDNQNGQLGDRTTIDRLMPVQIGSGIKAATAGNLHSLILKDDGSLWATGDNYFGQLGNGQTIKYTTPVLIDVSNVVKISANSHSLILKDDGSLWATGNNQHGQLGDGTTIKHSTPTQIFSSNMKKISAGYLHSLILKDDGSLWATGDNQNGQLGDGTKINRSTPVQIYSSGIRAIAAGNYHSLILKDDGSLWATGNNSYGQLGDENMADSSIPIQIYSSGVKAIAAGSSHSLILKDDGSLWANGNNQSGQLGDGTTVSNAIPLQIYSSGVQAISAGNSHTLILKEDGSLLVAGGNQNGQLGDGTLINRSTPVQIFASGVQTISAGYVDSLILKDDGSLWATGQNNYGQLGDGTIETKRTFTKVSTGVNSIAAGNNHSLFTKLNNISYLPFSTQEYPVGTTGITPTIESLKIQNQQGDIIPVFNSANVRSGIISVNLSKDVQDFFGYHYEISDGVSSVSGVFIKSEGVKIFTNTIDFSPFQEGKVVITVVPPEGEPKSIEITKDTYIDIPTFSSTLSDRDFTQPTREQEEGLKIQAEAGSRITITGGAQDINFTVPATGQTSFQVVPRAYADSVTGMGEATISVPLRQNTENALTITATDAAGNSASANIDIKQVTFDKVLEGSVETHILPPEAVTALIEKGTIDAFDPSNFQAVEFETMITIGDQVIPITLPVLVETTEESPQIEVVGTQELIIPGPIAPPDVPVGSGTVDPGSGSGTTGEVPPVPEVVPVPQEIVQTTFFVVKSPDKKEFIPGVIITDARGKILKEFFNSTIMLQNVSQYFTVHNLSVEYLPTDGLTIVEGSGSRTLADLQSGAKTQESYILRGDMIGKHPIRYKVSGEIRQGIESKILEGIISGEVDVYDPPVVAFSLAYPEQVVQDSTYSVTVVLENKSTVLPAMLPNITFALVGAVTPVGNENPFTLSFNSLRPGEKTSNVFKMRAGATGYLHNCKNSTINTIRLMISESSTAVCDGTSLPEIPAYTYPQIMKLMPMANQTIPVTQTGFLVEFDTSVTEDAFSGLTLSENGVLLDISKELTNQNTVLITAPRDFVYSAEVILQYRISEDNYKRLRYLTEKNMVDTAAPYIYQSRPVNNAVNVSLAGEMVMAFNELVTYENTSENKSFTLKNVSTDEVIPLDITSNGTLYTTVSIKPSGALLGKTSYVLQIRSIKDASGNVMPDTNISFTTKESNEFAIKTLKPTANEVVGLMPALFMEFNAAYETASLSGAFNLVDASGNEVTTYQSIVSGTQMTRQPTLALTPDTVYTFTIAPSIKSVYGIPLGKLYSVTFRTKKWEDLTPEEQILADNPQQATLYEPTSCLWDVKCAFFDKNGDLAPTSRDAKNATMSAIGDPVSLKTGEFLYENTFIRNRGRGIPYSFSLSNRSLATYNGPVGNGWDHNYNIFLTTGSDGVISYHDGEAHTFPFPKTSSGEYVRNTNIGATLFRDPQGNYSLQFDGGMRYDFDAKKRIKNIQDSAGNQLQFTHDVRGRLVTVTDTIGLKTEYSYNDKNRLTTVSDSYGQKVRLEYYFDTDEGGSSNDLKSVTLEKSGTATKTIGYTYTKVAGNNTLSHNIKTLTDAKGQIYVVNTYDESDRIATQGFGDGTLQYSYMMDIDNVFIKKTIVINKRGIQTMHEFDRFGHEISLTVGIGNTEAIYRSVYDGRGNKIREFYPLGNGISYRYNEIGQVTEKRQKANMTMVDNDESDIVTKYTYEGPFHNLTRVVDPMGAVVEFSYDERGNIISSRQIDIHLDSSDDTETLETFYEYDNHSQLVYSKDPEGNIAKYEYDAQGLPIRITEGIRSGLFGENTDGAITTSYTYDASGNPLTVTDPEGNTKTLTYDAFGLISSSITAEGIRTNYVHNANNKIESIQTVLEGGKNLTQLTTYNELDEIIKQSVGSSDADTRITETLRDADEKIIQTIDASGLKTKYTRDDLARVTEIRQIVDENDSSRDITVKFVFDANGNITKTIDPRGNSTESTYDRFDRVISTKNTLGTITRSFYNRRGNVIATDIISANGVIVSKSLASYDELGKVLSQTAVNHPESSQNTSDDIVTKYEYDKNGNLLTQINANGAETFMEYDSLGRMVSTEDALGNITKITYDKRGLVIKKELFDSSENLQLATGYRYDKDGRKIAEANALGKTRIYTYNVLGQITRFMDEAGRPTDYEYDIFGNMLTETKKVRDGETEKNVTTRYICDISNNLTSVTDANGNITQYEYDVLGRKIREILPDESVTSWTYDIAGNILSQTDPNGTTITNTYDNLNRLTRRDIQTGSGVTGVTSETYTYDALGRMISGNDSQNNGLAFSYDSFGRLVSETNNAKSVNYTYDTIGNITAIKYPSLKEISQEFDILGRPVRISRNGENIMNYTYDALTLRSLEYGNGVKTDLSYDSLFRLKELKYSNYTNPIIDEINTKITDGVAKMNGILPEDIAYRYDYDDVGNITSKNDEKYTYDTLDQLDSVLYDSKTSTGRVVDHFRTYDYDEVGNRETSGTRTRTTTDTQVCHYEKTTKVVNGKTITVNVKVCEPSKKVIESNRDNYYVSNNLNQYENYKTNSGATNEKIQNFIYDKNGNLTLDGKQRYVYDYRNRLIEVRTYNATMATKDNLLFEGYMYDILGRRLSKKIGNSTNITRYIYAGDRILEEIYKTDPKAKQEYVKEYIYGNQGVDDVIAMYKSDTVLTTEEQTLLSKCLADQPQYIKYPANYTEEYIDSCNQLIAKASERSVNPYFYHKDQLGSITAITDKDGKIVEQYKYDEYGKPFIYDVRSTVDAITGITTYTTRWTLLNTSKIGNDRLFTGREYNTRTDLYYYRARYYSPDLGRFISRDPIGIADNINLYAYVGNNPGRFTDPSGKWAKAFLAHEAGAIFSGAYQVTNDLTFGYLEDWLGFNRGYGSPNAKGWYARGWKTGLESAYILKTAVILESLPSMIVFAQSVPGMANNFVNTLRNGITNFQNTFSPAWQLADGTIYTGESVGVLGAGDLGMSYASISQMFGLGKQIHHFLTNKSSKYTAQFEEIVSEFGLKLDESWNKGAMEHLGRHAEKYHEYMLNKVTEIASESSSKEEFLEKFGVLKDYIKNNADMLYKRGWK